MLEKGAFIRHLSPKMTAFVKCHTFTVSLRLFNCQTSYIKPVLSPTSLLLSCRRCRHEAVSFLLKRMHFPACFLLPIYQYCIYVWNSSLSLGSVREFDDISNVLMGTLLRMKTTIFCIVPEVCPCYVKCIVYTSGLNITFKSTNKVKLAP
jgi:hypothetical protein